MNLDWSQRILAHLHSQGVRDIVFCPGARNSPLLLVLARTTGFQLHSFFDERAAGFYALGLSRKTGQPVVVMTTSGTAVCELLPAVVEAFHLGVPLVLLTADRPLRLRGTGAPQAIDQSGIFGKFVSLEFDLSDGQDADLAMWNRRSPAHLNICFDDPLGDRPTKDFELPPEEVRASYAGQSPFQQSANLEWAALRLSKFLKRETDLVILVGTLETEGEREAAVRFLKKMAVPCYLEATSGLREREELQSVRLTSGDRILSWALKRKHFGRVLRIGGIPTVRLWRDLDEKECDCEVLSLSPLPFAGLSRGELLCTEVAPALDTIFLKPPAIENNLHSLIDHDRKASEKLEALLVRFPKSEPGMFRRLSCLIPQNAVVYVGNSLPVREWDLAAERRFPRTVEANRGVNGIDGQLTTFLGLAQSTVENWAVVGDLTALYDLTAPWVLRESDLNVRIAVINNGGGKIFERMFHTEIFENRHQIEFSHWAKMWKLSYRVWQEVPVELTKADKVEVIELRPDSTETAQFWAEYDAIWA